MKHFCLGRIDRNTVSVRWESEKENVQVRRVGRRWVLEPIFEGLTLSKDDKQQILFLAKTYARWATAHGF
jgi:hypothetical protein